MKKEEIPYLPQTGPTASGLRVLEQEAAMEIYVVADGGSAKVGFRRPEGLYSDFPATEESALQHGMSIYEPYPRQKCPRCGRTVLMSADGRGLVCCSFWGALEVAVTHVNLGWSSSAAEARERGHDHYWRLKACMRCGGSGKRILSGQCFHCGAGGSRKEALAVPGTKLYQPTKPCDHGHLSERRVSGSICLMCEAENKTGLSPRQAAIDAGKDRYIPTEPCKKCGERAEKLVKDSRCLGCKPLRESNTIHKQFPDMVISKTDAAAAGMKVFRTGKECKHGHAGWRWISTGGCLTCQGRD